MPYPNKTGKAVSTGCFDGNKLFRMKRVIALAAALVAATMPAGASACGRVQPRPYLRAEPPDYIGDNEIVAQVELDTITPLSVRDQGVRFRVLWMIKGEPAQSLIVLRSMCSSETPGRQSGYLVATRDDRQGDTLVVRPVVPMVSSFYALPPRPGE